MELSAESTIATLLDALLPRGGSTGSPSRALYVRVNIGLSVYEPEEDSEAAAVHLIFERPTNYTKVWSCVDLGWKIPEAARFVIRSNHDSCWRTDGLRDMREAHLDALTKLRDRTPRGTRIHEFNRIELVQWVGVTYKTDPCDSYRKVLTEIVPLGRLDGLQGS